MPGFKINDIGGNGTFVQHEARFYASYSWDIPDLMTVIGKMLNSGVTGPSKLTSSILLKSAQLPSISFETIKAKGGAQEYKYAGRPTYDNIKITFYDTYGLVPGLKRWSEAVYNREQGIRTANYYKTTTRITKFLADANLTAENDAAEINEDDQTRTGVVHYDLYGAWPQAIKESDLTYVEASIKTVDITLTYDYFVMSEPESAFTLI